MIEEGRTGQGGGGQVRGAGKRNRAQGMGQGGAGPRGMGQGGAWPGGQRKSTKAHTWGV